jgi:hypothetical protein
MTHTQPININIDTLADPTTVSRLMHDIKKATRELLDERGMPFSRARVQLIATQAILTDFVAGQTDVDEVDEAITEAVDAVQCAVEAANDPSLEERSSWHRWTADHAQSADQCEHNASAPLRFCAALAESLEEFRAQLECA